MSFIVGLDQVTIQIDDGDEAPRQALEFYVEPLDRSANIDNVRFGAWLQFGSGGTAQAAGGGRSRNHCG
jgi:hypothetical protein